MCNKRNLLTVGSVAVLALALSYGLTGHAVAQSQQQPIPAEQVPTGNGITTMPSDAGPGAANIVHASTPYADLDQYAMKGWITPFPTVQDSILRDEGGFRSDLADAGVGFYFISTNQAIYNLLQNDQNYHGSEVYNGQKFNLSASQQIVILTYDLGRIGLRGGQVVATGAIDLNDFQGRNGPDNESVNNLYYFQPLFKHLFEFEVGYINNSLDFLGLLVGGNLANGGLGPQSSIPFEVGLSNGGFGAPTASVKINLTNQFYDRFAVQRSLPTGGIVTDEVENPSGLRFSLPGTSPLYVNETGYKVDAGTTTRSFWFRAGGIYNATHYDDFNSNKQSQNWAVYALVDRQLTKPDPALPFRGLYVGASFNYAPPAMNLFSKYFEVRAYDFGLFARRPFDLASFVATYNGYSRAGRQALASPTLGSYANTQTYIASYAYRLMSGLYVQPGLGVVVHPFFTPKLGTALNGYLALTAIL